MINFRSVAVTVCVCVCLCSLIVSSLNRPKFSFDKQHVCDYWSSVYERCSEFGHWTCGHNRGFVKLWWPNLSHTTETCCSNHWCAWSHWLSHCIFLTIFFSVHFFLVLFVTAIQDQYIVDVTLNSDYFAALGEWIKVKECDLVTDSYCLSFSLFFWVMQTPNIFCWV
jgi:hypothetical protein